LLFVKGIVYREKVQNVSELSDRIVRAVEGVTNEMVATIWRETEYRLDVYRATNGAILRYTEHIRNFVGSSV